MTATGDIEFDDEHITVSIADFRPSTGELQVAIKEKHPRVGVYRIRVEFTSGNQHGYDYDGDAPNRLNPQPLQVTKPNDTITGIKAFRMRDPFPPKK